MASTKNYGMVATCNNTMDEIAFYELYRTKLFFYDSEETRKKNDIAISKRCKKKGIPVTFKYITRKQDEDEANEQS